MLCGKERGQIIDPVESALAQYDPFDRQDPVTAAVLIQHPFTDPQRLYGAGGAIGHRDASAGDKAGLGIGLIHLPLILGEIITERVRKQGECDGRANKQSALAGLEWGL